MEIVQPLDQFWFSNKAENIKTTSACIVEIVFYSTIISDRETWGFSILVILRGFIFDMMIYIVQSF